MVCRDGLIEERGLMIVRGGYCMFTLANENTLGLLRSDPCV